MNHKERCRRLKAIRKAAADSIGLDLHQTECTYAGECSGTCPKCAKEESVLNKALAASAVAVTSVMLSACSLEKVPSGVTDNNTNGGNEVIEQIAGDEGPKPDYIDDNSIAGGEEEIIELAGDVPDEEPYIDDELAGEEVCSYELEDQYNGLRVAKNYSGAPLVCVETENADGSYVVQCYEEVDDGDGESHIVTWDRLTVDPNNNTVTDSNGDEIDFIAYW